MLKVKIETDFIKLDQFLKWSGAVSSGVDAKFLVQNGEVLVNGNVETQRGKKLRPGDTVEYNGESYEVC
jgi:S4 domain protein YaaA